MRKLLMTVAVASSMLFSGAAAYAADTTVIVSGSGYGWSATRAAGGQGSFIAGPLGASGSYRLNTSSSNVNDKVSFFTSQFAGTPLASITGLGYRTYRESPANGSASLASLQLRVQWTANALDGIGMLAYEPYWTHGNSAIINGQWQAWDAFAGRWWTSKIASSALDNRCSADNPCTWPVVQERFPDARLSGSSFGINQGTYNTGTVSYVDWAAISIGANKTTFDFGPAVADTTKPSCGTMVVTRGTGGNPDYAEVTISDPGSGIASITNFSVTNGSASVPAFTPGTTSVTVRATKTTQGQSTFFEFGVKDQAGNTTHCV